MNLKSRGLGRGLSELFAERTSAPKQIGLEEEEKESKGEFLFVEISMIRPCPSQPRKIFEEARVRELAESVGMHGVLQPILLRPQSSGHYEIVAGERRWRAAMLCGLTRIPARILDIDNETAALFAIIENLQRENLTPIEEAQSYQTLADMGYTHEKIAQKIKKSRSHITNYLRLNTLPDSVKDMVNKGLLTAAHARTIATNPDVEQLAQRIIDEDLSVRKVEKILRLKNGEIAVNITNRSRLKGMESNTKEGNPDFKDIAGIIQSALSMPVAVEKGVVRIFFDDLEQLDRLMELLSR